MFASNATTSAPHGLRPRPVYSTLNVTGLVTSRIVKSPVKSYSASPVFLISVATNVICGYFSASKKSSERKCISRSSLRELILATSIINLISASVKSSGSNFKSAVNVSNEPRTFAIIICLTSKPKFECALSTLNTCFVIINPPRIVYYLVLNTS